MSAKTPVIPEKIEMIALDLDGTTLSRGHITPRTRKALELAIEQGIQVVIATGRVFAALPDDIFKIRGLRYVLTSNGAMMTDLKWKDVIYMNCIGEEAVKKVTSALRSHPQFPVEMFTDGQAYIGRNYYDELTEWGEACTYMSRAYVLRTRTPVENVYDYMELHGKAIENINIHFRNNEERMYMRKLLEGIPEITLTSSMKLNIEVGGASTSKASGLAALCELTGTSLAHTMACGDSHNDMAMMEECGLGIAVGNAEAEVLEMADCIVPSNEEEGVAFAVEKYALQRERPQWQLSILRVKNHTLSSCRRLAKKVLRRNSGRR